MKSLKNILIVLIIISFWLVPLGNVLFSDQQDREEQTLMEEVTVVNVQFPVRVFLKGRPVGGLVKKDFKLFVDGKETPINGFFEVRKKLNAPMRQSGDLGGNEGPPPRLFVFIFNVSDYNLNLENDVEIIFRKILRPNDRFMVISNNFFLAETTVKDPELEKKRVLDTLQREAHKLRMSVLEVESDLNILARNFIFRLTDPIERKMPDFPYQVFRDYFTEYLLVFEQFKMGYFNMAKAQYIKVAEYLKVQDAEKWVLNFYQVGIFPRFKLHGQIWSAMNLYLDTDDSNTDGVRMKALILDFLPRLDDVDKWVVDNISNLFVNSGATIHTLLRKPVKTTFMAHYEYKPVATDSESILRKIARLTGGSVVRSKSADEFIDVIASKEDIYYMLTYVPEKNEDRNSAVRVVINNDKDFRLAYDSQRKPRLFKKILDKIKRYNPQIKIGAIVLVNDILNVKVSNIKTIRLSGRGKVREGRIEATVMIMNSQSEIVWETRKFYKSKESIGMFQTQVPLLEKGNYNVLVQVKDLLTWNTDAAGENVTTGTSIGGI
jgi:hypothetical protein